MTAVDLLCEVGPHPIEGEPHFPHEHWCTRGNWCTCNRMTCAEHCSDCSAENDGGEVGDDYPGRTRADDSRLTPPRGSSVPAAVATLTCDRYQSGQGEMWPWCVHCGRHLTQHDRRDAAAGVAAPAADDADAASRRVSSLGETRERSVPCSYCRRPTWNLDAICDRDHWGRRMIDYDDQAEQDHVELGPGWQRITPPTGSRRGRTYLDHEGNEYESLTSVLGRGIPVDYGPWNTCNEARDCWPELRALDAEEARLWLSKAGDRVLDRAAARGSAVHRAVEGLLAGIPVDRDDLERHEATPWLLAVERFMADARPEADLIETVAFDPERSIACTLDFLGRLHGDDMPDGVGIIDWKTRTTKHDRREKEAAQLGGQYLAVTEGWYCDDRGNRRQAEVDWLAVVTFCPDGTWGLHRLDADEAVVHYLRGVGMARRNLVSVLYDGRAVKADPPDHSAIILARIDALDDDRRARLGKLWRQAGLGRPSEGEIGADDWLEADRLVAKVEAPVTPFPEDRRTPTAYAPQPQVDTLTKTVNTTPADLRAKLRTANPALWQRWDSGIVTAQDADDIEAALASIAEEATDRLAEIVELVALVHELDQPMPALILADRPDQFVHWTPADLEAVSILAGAATAGTLIVRDGALMVSPTAAETLAAGGKRDVVAKAKPLAESLARPRPTKWADVAGDPLLFAAVSAA